MSPFLGRFQSRFNNSVGIPTTAESQTRLLKIYDTYIELYEKMDARALEQALEENLVVSYRYRDGSGRLNSTTNNVAELKYEFDRIMRDSRISSGNKINARYQHDAAILAAKVARINQAIIKNDDIKITSYLGGLNDIITANRNKVGFNNLSTIKKGNLFTENTYVQYFEDIDEARVVLETSPERKNAIENDRAIKKGR